MSTPRPARVIPVKYHCLRFLSVIGGFLDGQTFEFSSGLNCLIGARGTGKTTVLELARYALNMLPSYDSNPIERRRIESLMKRNLAGGCVRLGIETRDGLVYVVSRYWGEEPMVLTADGQPTGVTLHNGGIFKADIYSQNEVERIADHVTMQLHLIDNFEAQQIADVQLELFRLQSLLTTNAAQILPIQRRLAALGEELNMLPNVESQLMALAADNGHGSDEINHLYSLKGLRYREQRVVDGVGELLGTTANDLARLSRLISREVASVQDRDVAEGPNDGLLENIMQHFCACGRDIDRLLDLAQRRVENAKQEVDDEGSRLSTIHKEQELTFHTLIEKYRQPQSKAAERMQLEKLHNDLLAKRSASEAARKEVAALQQHRTALLTRLSELRDKRFAVRKVVADRISESLAPDIRVTISQYGNPECYCRLLEESLRNTHVKHGVVAHKLANAFCPIELSDVLRRKDAPILVDKAELSQDQAEKTIAALSDDSVLFELETVEMLDRPQIELKDGEEYKDSLMLSTGQKCTAILPILLLDSANPLLIDQPEDNLDNRFIFEKVIGSIRNIKQWRQLIFVTHNPNIPVLANAEKVFVLESDGLAARIANEGSVEECKAEIVTLLEGGEEAFNRRKERYSC